MHEAAERFLGEFGGAREHESLGDRVADVSAPAREFVRGFEERHGYPPEENVVRTAGGPPRTSRGNFSTSTR